MAVQALCYLDVSRMNSWDVQKRVGSIHLLAWFGLNDALEDILRGLSKSACLSLLNSRNHTHGRTVLMYACRQDHMSTVQKLIEWDARIDTRDCLQSTALFETVISNPEVLKAPLQAAKLDINIVHPQRSAPNGTHAHIPLRASTS